MHALDDLSDPARDVVARHVTSYTMNGFIHILLVVALVVLLIRVIQGSRPVI